MLEIVLRHPTGVSVRPMGVYQAGLDYNYKYHSTSNKRLFFYSPSIKLKVYASKKKSWASVKACYCHEDNKINIF